MTEKKSPHQHPAQKSSYHDLFMAILGGFAIFLLISIPISIEEPAADYPFYKGPAIFPIIILSVMCLSALPSFYRLLLKIKSREQWHLDGKGFPTLPVKIFLLLIVVFLSGFICIGLELACFLFFLVAMIFIGYRTWWKLILYPGLYTVFIVILFKYLLDIYFPEPLIYHLWGG